MQYILVQQCPLQFTSTKLLYLKILYKVYSLKIISHFGEDLVTSIYMCKSSHRFFQISFFPESLSSISVSQLKKAGCRLH